MISELESVAKQLTEMEFLYPGEDLNQIISDDNSAVGQLGLVNAQIAARMEYFFKEIVKKRHGYIGREMVNEQIDGFNIKGYNANEFVLCPSHRANIQYGSFDITVANSLGENVTYSGVNVHLIGCHNFYGGGRGRREPTLLARVLDIKPVVKQL